MRVLSTKHAKWFVKHDVHSCALGFGWGHGYVAVGKGHPWYGYHYENSGFDDIVNKANVPYLTYSEWGEDEYKGMWVLGFHTMYSYTKDFYQKDVEERAKRLYEIALRT